jgi:methionyl-tRNA formyltransferase
VAFEGGEDMKPVIPKVLFVTQNDRLYLPLFFDPVLAGLGDRAVCIVACPPFGRIHGGRLKGALRSAAMFGARGTAVILCRSLRAAVLELLGRRTGDGFCSIRQLARHRSVPFHRISLVNSSEFASLVEMYAPEVLVSVSFPQKVGRDVRRLFPSACLNVHNGPLPAYRGMMPTFWVLRNGEEVTASTVHFMTARIDDGDILVQKPVPISPEETWDSLMKKTRKTSADALLEALEMIAGDRVDRIPNSREKATWYSLPGKPDWKAFRTAGRRFF